MKCTTVAVRSSANLHNNTKCNTGQGVSFCRRRPQEGEVEVPKSRPLQQSRDPQRQGSQLATSQNNKASLNTNSTLPRILPVRFDVRRCRGSARWGLPGLQGLRQQLRPGAKAIPDLEGKQTKSKDSAVQL